MATKKDADPRLTRRQAENTRAAIQAGQLVRILHESAMGDRTLTPAQVKSAQILLGKVLPDQQKIETEDVTEPMSLGEIRESMIQMILEDPTLVEEANRRKEQSEAVSDNVVELAKK